LNPHSGFRDDFSEIDLQRIRNSKKRINRGIPGICFQSADERLTKAGFLGKRNTGYVTALSLFS